MRIHAYPTYYAYGLHRVRTCGDYTQVILNKFSPGSVLAPASPQEFRPNGEFTSIEFEDEIDPAAGAASSVFELRLRLSSCGGRDCGPA